MGGATSKSFEYAEFTGEEKKGETRILRHPEIVGKEMLTEPEPGVNTLWKAFEHSVLAHGNRPFLGQRKFISKDKYGDYEWRTYKEVDTDVRDFAAGMAILKLCPEVESKEDGVFKFLGIYSKNRPEWIISDLASHLNGVTVVTFYDTLGENTIEFILEQTNLTSVVMESKALKKMIHLKKASQSGNLQNLILLDVEDEALFKEAESVGYVVYRYPDILEAGRGKVVEFTPAKPETIATFCYTSGTTGVPKGAMIHHGGIIADIASLRYTDVDIRETDVHLSYLPLAHVMERVVFTACILKSVAVGFFQGNALKLIEDAQMLKPTIFIGVPRIYQRIYEVITTGMDKLGYVKKSLSDRAVRAKLDAYRKNGALTHSVWDRLVFNKTKNALGGRVRKMLTGSAPIAADMLEFLKICFSCPILEGYGATETCACACLTRADDNKIGHCGGPVASVEMKLVDCESLNYFSTDVDENGVSRPRGEICFRGNIIFKGYFNDKENTSKAIDSDGWLHTGDVGAILTQQGNALKIIDRVKNIFKLSHGEYIAPEKLENVLIKCKYVQQVFVHGDSLENYLISIVVPKKDPCVEFLQSKGVTDVNKDNVHEHFTNKDLIADVLKEMETLGRKCDFKGFEVIKKVTLVNEPFTIDNDLLTPTMKLKRNIAQAKYKDDLKRMYSEK